MNRAALFIAILCLQVGCTSAPTAIAPAPQPAFTPELARDALIDLIRREPELFAGNPLPERLAQLPVKSRGDGTFSFSAFVIDPARKTYSAEVGLSGPAPYFYNGDFVRRDNTWIATEPNVLHMHQPVPPPAP